MAVKLSRVAIGLFVVALLTVSVAAVSGYGSFQPVQEVDAVVNSIETDNEEIELVVIEHIEPEVVEEPEPELVPEPVEEISNNEVESSDDEENSPTVSDQDSEPEQKMASFLLWI